jgi:hypothetical protein
MCVSPNWVEKGRARIAGEQNVGHDVLLTVDGKERT